MVENVVSRPARFDLLVEDLEELEKRQRGWKKHGSIAKRCSEKRDGVVFLRVTQHSINWISLLTGPSQALTGPFVTELLKWP